MDFNTGTGGTGESRGSSPPPSDPGGSSRRTPSAGATEFTYTDPVPSLIDTVRSVVLAPADFFRGIRRQGDFLNPLVFALICASVGAVLGGIIGFFVSVGFADMGVGSAFVGLIGSIIRSLLSVAIGLFIGAAIWHLLVMLLVRPGNAGYEATFRVAAYASVVSLVSWIPILGWLLGLYAIFLAVVGIREVHTTTTGRAALVVLIPTAVVLLLVLLVVFVVGAAIFFNAQQ
jgi:hypothetical protein